jgi:hypothetical protein
LLFLRSASDDELAAKLCTLEVEQGVIIGIFAGRQACCVSSVGDTGLQLLDPYHLIRNVGLVISRSKIGIILAGYRRAQ